MKKTSCKVTEFNDSVVYGMKVGYSNKQLRNFAEIFFYLCFVSNKEAITVSLESVRDLVLRAKKRSFSLFLYRKIVGIGIMFHKIRNKISSIFKRK